MGHVRGHYRRDGSYVRPHYRRTRQAARPSTRPAPRAHGPRVEAAPTTGPTTWVRGHYRNGAYVRPHHRRISGPAVAVSSGAGILLFLLILLAVASVGGADTTENSGKHSTRHTDSGTDSNR